MSGLLNGKIALVTGAASGIGKATAMAMAAEGASVVLSDVSDETGKAVAGELTADGAQALYVHADVAASSDVDRLFDSALSRFGRIDCAFNNAGIAGDNALTAEITEASWERMLSINITGVWLCMKYQLPAMRTITENAAHMKPQNQYEPKPIAVAIFWESEGKRP